MGILGYWDMATPIAHPTLLSTPTLHMQGNVWTHWFARAPQVRVIFVVVARPKRIYEHSCAHAHLCEGLFVMSL